MTIVPGRMVTSRSGSGGVVGVVAVAVVAGTVVAVPVGEVDAVGRGCAAPRPASVQAPSNTATSTSAARSTGGRLLPVLDLLLACPPVVGVLVIELHIPSARSLKEKRAAVRPIVASARARYSVSIAEVGYQDLHQRCELEVAAVASAPHVVTEMLDAVERLVWSAPD
ncbi:MAG: DUF503 domain-containing protein, partial [Acidimicrobiales bacterium]